MTWRKCRTLGIVCSDVCGRCQNLKVFWPIIESISVLMVDMFPPSKVSTESLLYNKSMKWQGTSGSRL